MVAKKRKSKRQTLQQKYRVVKRVREHNKKLKKGAVTGIHKKKVDNTIPASWPFKAELLKEIADAKERAEEKKQQQKDSRRELLAKKRAAINANNEDDDSRKLKNLSVVARGLENTLNNDGQVEEEVMDEDGEDNGAGNGTGLGQNSRRAFMRELRKVVERSDVILQVLDARDPIGTKSVAVEEMVLSHAGKKLVYVLNKADLVPKEVLVGWVNYLRQFHATIPFKSNTQSQKENLGSARQSVLSQKEDVVHSTAQAVGTEEVLNLLKNYARLSDGSHSSKSIISVGVVGFPNVGKSSLINSLMRSRAVGVSSMPGFTKQLQEVILDKNIRLVDSPGVVFADGNSAATILRNCVNVEEMVDVVTPVSAILDRCPSMYLMQVYGIPSFPKGDAQAFLVAVAKATGKLKKGGVPNVDQAGRTVLHDWNNGKIKYYCKPPEAGVTALTEDDIANADTLAKAVNDREALRNDTTVSTQAADALDLDKLVSVRVIRDLYEEKPSKKSDFYVGVDSVAEVVDMEM